MVKIKNSDSSVGAVGSSEQWQCHLGPVRAQSGAGPAADCTMSPRLLLLLASLAPPLHGLTISGTNTSTSISSNTTTNTSSSSGSYIQTFFSVIGVGLGNLMGLELGTAATSGQDTVLRETGTSHTHTRPNTTVPRPVCAATSAECRARDRRGAEQLITCGKAAHHGRVVNGSAAAPGAHPWAVQIRTKVGKIFCSGTLVTRRHVLTAAHCFSRVRASEVVLVVGNVFTKRALSPHHAVRRVVRLHSRPDFDLRTYDNDLAVVRLDRAVQWSEAVRPLCVPDTRGEHAGQLADIVGWGRTRFNGQLPGRLREARVPVLSQEQCRHGTKYVPREITDNMLCAGYRDTAHIDACQGDSGGPLIKTEAEHKILIGIVSWGIECAKPGYPGVYTRVGAYLDWIRDIVAADGDCFCEQEAEEEAQEAGDTATTEERLETEIRRLRQQLELLAEKGGEVIVDLTSKLKQKDNVIGDLKDKIRNMTLAT